jgi:hypothetical protein
LTSNPRFRPNSLAKLPPTAADSSRMARVCSKRLVHVPAAATKLNQDRLENTLREMGQFSHKIPSLPDEAFTRESLYQDHD